MWFWLAGVFLGIPDSCGGWFNIRMLGLLYLFVGVWCWGLAGEVSCRCYAFGFLFCLCGVSGIVVLWLMVSLLGGVGFCVWVFSLFEGACGLRGLWCNLL